MKHDDFVVYYQPVLDIESMQVIGAEALLRWNRDQTGLVSPGEFIPALEEIGLITSVGEWVLRTVCKQSLDWQQMGLPPLRMMVNLSPRQFSDHNLTKIITNILDETGIEPNLIDLEITESVLMADNRQNCDTLNELKELGVHISLDDFGTGYSSLSYLKHFPIDILKIDQSFIRDLTQSSDSVAIVTAILALANVLQLEVIAEGVESDAQLTLLRSLNCNIAQGFLFDRPMPADAFENLFQHLTSSTTEKLPDFSALAV